MNKNTPGCTFCNIVQRKNKKKDQIIFEDELCVAFDDHRKKSAKEHILFVPKAHVKDVNAMRKKDIPLLNHLQKTAEDYLKKRFPNEKYRYLTVNRTPVNIVDLGIMSRL